jgi:hypothetical protein
MIGDIYEGHLISNNHSAITKTLCATPLQICALYTKKEEKDETCIFKKFVKNVHNFIWKSEGKRPLGKSTRRWEHSNEKDLTETEFEGVKRILLAHDMDHQWAVVNMVMQLRTE